MNQLRTSLDMKTFGKTPLSTAAPAEKVNLFAPGFPDGVRLQFAILPQADEVQVGDILGVAQVWVVSGAKPLTATTPSLTIPMYRAGSDIKIFKQATGLICTAHYVATLDTKPYFNAKG
jgi:hypothetical protein